MTDRFYMAQSLEARVPLLGPSIGRTSNKSSAFRVFVEQKHKETPTYNWKALC
jgi:hypothetical protein